MAKNRPGASGDWQTGTGLVLPDELKWPEGSTREQILAHLKRLLAQNALDPEAARFVRNAYGLADSNAAPNGEL